MDTKGKMSAADVLREARRIVGAKERWTKDENARDRHGCRVNPLSSHAVQWCALGAVARAEGKVSSLTDAVLQRAARDVSSGTWTNEVMLNDFAGYATVLRMFDRAIDLAVAEEEAGAA